jgi:hypothetical protein
MPRVPPPAESHNPAICGTARARAIELRPGEMSQVSGTPALTVGKRAASSRSVERAKSPVFCTKSAKLSDCPALRERTARQACQLLLPPLRTWLFSWFSRRKEDEQTTCYRKTAVSAQKKFEVLLVVLRTSSAQRSAGSREKRPDSLSPSNGSGEGESPKNHSHRERFAL